jgi:ferritin-like metal-binding protein YciE
METMINLNDLLKHEILDLYSAEEQIIEALPAMIEKAKNPELKKALREHLKITEDQKSRLDKVKQTFGEGDGQDGENKGFFSRLFGGGNGKEKCRGMEGLITEGEKIMKADITDEALDAAIIASAQKIEHYEICGYGTARAFARELKLAEVERLLTQTLNEEYEADDRLTSLAVGKLNIEAEQAGGMGENEAGSSAHTVRKSRTAKGSSSNGSSKSSAGSNGNSSKAASKVSGNGASKSSSTKSGNKNSSKSASSKGANKSSGGSSSKGASSKSASSKSNSSKSTSKSPLKSTVSKSVSKAGNGSKMKKAGSSKR